jgi:8-oxo-dGTP pyrophosphatase MutT (NUDIX family)
MQLSVKKFKSTPKQEAFKCPILSVYERTLTAHESNSELKVHTIKFINWINIVPVTSKGEILLVEQYRFGSDEITLETPGGGVDKHEKDPTMAAVRELEEETGHTSKKVLGLPSFSPNPAVNMNTIFYFLAFDVQPIESHIEPDPFEVIKLHKVPFQEVLELTRTGQMKNVLANYAILLAEPYLKNKFN